jgi:hypothetical protein
LSIYHLKGRLLVDSNKIIPVAIIAIAVMSLVVYFAFNGTSQPGSTTDTTAAMSQPPAQSTEDLPSQSTGEAAVPQATPPADTDPVSSKEPATVVPDKMTLDAFCNTYYDAWLKEDWKTAYTMIPYSKQKEMDVDAFKQRNEQYGLASAQVGKPAINKNAATVIASMNLSMGMTWYTTWSFVKNDKGQWTVQSTASSMGGQK